MSRRARCAWRCARVTLLIVFGAAAAAAQPGDAVPWHVCELPALAPDEGEAGADARLGAVRAARVRCATPSASFVVTYDGFPTAARAAFQAAVDTWSCLIATPVPIRVAARWAPLGSTTLGTAGPYLVRNAASAPQRDTWYPSALADALAGRDLDARTPDIDAAFNAEFPDWHFDPDTHPLPSQYDLYTVVLHELGHGLGVIGGLAVENGRGVVGRAPSRGPFIYDRFTETTAGHPLLDAARYPDGSVALAQALTSPVWFDGPAVRQAVSAGGGRVQLYTPDAWAEGASYSHLDEARYPTGTPDGLMTPFLRRGEAIEQPGAGTCAILADLGWRLAGACNALVGPVDRPFAGVSVERLGSNPFSVDTRVGLRVSSTQRLRVTLVDSAARTVAVLADDTLAPGAEAVVRVDGQGLAAGVYWLVVAGEGGRTSVPLVVVR